jgi:hypothetical protein
MRFRQFEVVRLVEGFPADGIEPGTLAVVLDAHASAEPGREARYELEVHLPSRPLYTASATESQITPLLMPARRKLWIMPGHGCHAFWATDGSISGVHDNISADALGLSPALVAAVAEWEAAFAATFVEADSGSSGLADAAAEEAFRAAKEAFRAAGSSLAERVAAELGSGWDVVYRYGEEDAAF